MKEPHNFDNLGPEIIGVGYRVLAVGELIPKGAQAWDGEEWFEIRLFEGEKRYVLARHRVTRRVKIDTEREEKRAELRNNRRLRERTPQEWQSAIKKLPRALANRVASVVFWDFFGLRTVAERWPHLDKYIQGKQDLRIPNAEIIKGLIEVGYSPKRAELRLSAKGAQI